MKLKATINIRFLSVIFLIGFLLVNTSSSYSQNSICEPCFKLAEYIASSNKADYFIKNTGYEPPLHLKSQWKKFPAIRKIEMAYEAFQNKGNGEKFLSKLSHEINKKNGAISYETKLKSLLDLKDVGHLDYLHSTKYQKTNLSKPIRKQIMAISKYTEAGAFGGVRGVLQHKLGLPEDNVYKILRESTSFTDAFKRGLDQAQIPPSQQKRIVNLTKDLMKRYPSARHDETLKKFLKKNNIEFTNPRTKIFSSIYKKNHISSSLVKVSSKTTYLSNKYRQYRTKHYSKTISRLFAKMSKTAKGFGGVIFGNKIEDRTNLPNLKHLRFISTDTINGLVKGNLELIFIDGTELVEYGIYAEDAFAANNLVFNDNEINYKTHEGIGLVGIKSSSIEIQNYYETRGETILHPVIANLQLGWSALTTDALPIAHSELYKSLKESENYNIKDSILVSNALNNTKGNYKIIDVPIGIRKDENQLEFFRLDVVDSLRIKDTFITMHSFIFDFSRSKDTVFENKAFYKVMPILTNTIYEYHRINQFAKIFALFRWAKSKGAKPQNMPIIEPYLESPEFIFFTDDKYIKYYSPQEERSNFKKVKLIIEKKLDSILKKHNVSFNKNVVNRINKNIDKLWSFTLSNPAATEKSKDNITQVFEKTQSNIDSAYTKLNDIDNYYLWRYYQYLISILKDEVIVIKMFYEKK